MKVLYHDRMIVLMNGEGSFEADSETVVVDVQHDRVLLIEPISEAEKVLWGVKHLVGLTEFDITHTHGMFVKRLHEGLGYMVVYRK